MCVGLTSLTSHSQVSREDTGPEESYGLMQGS
jgi:hypothetical protein